MDSKAFEKWVDGVEVEEELEEEVESDEGESAAVLSGVLNNLARDFEKTAPHLLPDVNKCRGWYCCLRHVVIKV